MDDLAGSQDLMSVASLQDVIGSPFFVAAAYVIAGCAYYGYGALERRDPLLRRVDAIAPPRTAPHDPWKRFRQAAERRPGAMDWLLKPSERYELARRLARFQIEEMPGALMFIAIRTLAAAAGLAAAWSAAGVFGVTSLPFFLAPLGLAAGWFIPGSILRTLMKRRQAAIAQGLPDALELLVVCSEAGLALAPALGRVASELRQSQPALAEELAVTAADLKVLPDPNVALGNLARRIDLPVIRTIVTCIAQTMRYGTPLAQALRVAASDLRNDAMILLEERAGRLPVLLTIPMILFILPTVFLIVGGPSVLQAIDAFGGP
jgi:tight adherence protein C